MKLDGQVIEALTNGQFMVQLPDQRLIRCYLAGRLRMNHIKIILGDKVTIELPTGSEIGRISYRNK